jgi:hypothetical protein
MKICSASYIDIQKPMITGCPSCNGVELESLPVSEKEVYKSGLLSS